MKNVCLKKMYAVNHDDCSAPGWQSSGTGRQQISGKSTSGIAPAKLLGTERSTTSVLLLPVKLMDTVQITLDCGDQVATAVHWRILTLSGSFVV